MNEVSALLTAAASATGQARDTLFHTARTLSLREAIVSCTRCALHSTANAPVPWEGGPADIAIIGEAPGADEDRIGRPFVGRAGKLLDKTLLDAGFGRSDRIAYINTVCCRPPENKFQLAVDANAPLACRPWLTQQIAITGAWILVPVGNQALWSVLPKLTSGITGVRGKPMWQGQHLVLPTFHPAYALRDLNAREALEFDLRKLARIYHGEAEAPVPKNYDPSILISSLRRPGTKLTPPEADRFAKHFSARGWVAAYSHWLEDDIICVRDDAVRLPPRLTGVKYTVRELTQLSHFDRSWETARRIHYTKKLFGATIV